MKTIKLELSVKLLLGAIALGLFLNAFNDFPPKTHAVGHDVAQKVIICDSRNHLICAGVSAGRLKTQE